MSAARAPLAKGGVSAEAALARTLADAERAGLRLAIKARLVALALLALWFVGSRSGVRGAPSSSRP